MATEIKTWSLRSLPCSRDGFVHLGGGPENIIVSFCDPKTLGRIKCVSKLAGTAVDRFVCTLHPHVFRDVLYECFGICCPKDWDGKRETIENSDYRIDFHGALYALPRSVIDNSIAGEYEKRRLVQQMTLTTWFWDRDLNPLQYGRLMDAIAIRERIRRFMPMSLNKVETLQRLERTIIVQFFGGPQHNEDTYYELDYTPHMLFELQGPPNPTQEVRWTAQGLVGDRMDQLTIVNKEIPVKASDRCAECGELNTNAEDKGLMHRRLHMDNDRYNFNEPNLRLMCLTCIWKTITRYPYTVSEHQYVFANAKNSPYQNSAQAAHKESERRCRYNYVRARSEIERLIESDAITCDGD
jgi:hypothetical protein